MIHETADLDDQVDRLIDLLAEHPEPEWTVYSSAHDWPDEFDDVVVALGPPRGVDEEFIPTHEEEEAYLNLMERLEYEAGFRSQSYVR